MLTMTSSRHYQQLHKLSYYDIILIEKDSLYNYYCYIILKLLACHSNFMNCNWHAYMVQDSGVHKWLSILMCTQSLLSILVCTQSLLSILMCTQSLLSILVCTQSLLSILVCTQSLLSILVCTQSLFSMLVCMHGSALSCAWLSIFV